MNGLKLILVAVCVVSVLSSAAMAQDSNASPAGLEAKKPGEVVKVGGLSITVKEMKFLPVVENDYSRRFLYDSFDNPRLKALREGEKLDAVVAAGKTEFEKQLLLMHWDFKRFKKFGNPDSQAQSAADILKAVDEGHAFYCAHYASVFVSAAASLGWVDRSIGLHVGNRQVGGRGQGYTEHSMTEIWSNQYGKWVMLDPTFDVYVEKAGLPLSAWEIRQEWFYGDANSLDFVAGDAGKHYRLKDFPVRLPHPGTTGNFPLEQRTFDVYGFLMFYTSTTDPLDAPGESKDRPAFIVKDANLCDKVKWHTRDNPKDPAREPYFPLDQAALKLTPAADGSAKIIILANTMTPNFANYRCRINGGTWEERGGASDYAPAQAGAKPSAGEMGKRGPVLSTWWPLKEGTNTFEVVSVNKFGVEGTPSKVVLEAAK